MLNKIFEKIKARRELRLREMYMVWCICYCHTMSDALMLFHHLYYEPKHRRRAKMMIHIHSATHSVKEEIIAYKFMRNEIGIKEAIEGLEELKQEKEAINSDSK